MSGAASAEHESFEGLPQELNSQNCSLIAGGKVCPELALPVHHWTGAFPGPESPPVLLLLEILGLTFGLLLDLNFWLNFSVLTSSFGLDT